jgi:hypothetical protein
MPGRHFVLDQPSAESHASKLLARVTLDIKDPLRAFAPREAAEGTSTGRNPQDIIPNLMPTPLLSTNRKDLIQKKVSSEGRTGLADFFGFNIARTDEEKLALESEIVKRYSLDQTKDVFDRLMKDPLYNSEVRKFLKDHGVRKAFFVVGFITTEGSVWARDRTREHSASIKGQVPLSSVTATPIPGPDLSMKLSTSDNNSHEQKFSFKGPLIFAVAYDVVKLKRTFDKAVPGYFRDDVVLGPAKYAKAKHLTMRPDEDEMIEEEEEDLDEDAGRDDDVEFGGDLDLEDIDFEWDGLSFNVQ